jgi:hypothetical protein
MKRMCAWAYKDARCRARWAWLGFEVPGCVGLGRSNCLLLMWTGHCLESQPLLVFFHLTRGVCTTQDIRCATILSQAGAAYILPRLGIPLRTVLVLEIHGTLSHSSTHGLLCLEVGKRVRVLTSPPQSKVSGCVREGNAWSSPLTLLTTRDTSSCSNCSLVSSLSSVPSSPLALAAKRSTSAKGHQEAP